MNLFDDLVQQALSQHVDLSTLKVVVEKELLHHDILRIMSKSHLLKELTFIGGTCLRSCYGGVRLSEDLDFTGGTDFTQEKLVELANIITSQLNEKYGLKVTVTPPKHETTNVSTWKISVETRPKQMHLPKQRINIDICAINSYDIQPMLLLNPYGVDMGTSGLIIRSQSREEIFTDKFIAFAMRPNRIKYRDLWDILWLHQQNIKPKLGFITNKLNDRKINARNFIENYQVRTKSLQNNPSIQSEFTGEMRRFLPGNILSSIEQDDFWSVICFLMNDYGRKIESELL